MVPEVYFHFRCVISKNKKQMLNATKNSQICCSFVINKLCEKRPIFILYNSLNTPKNVWFSIVFQGVYIRTIVQEWVNKR